MIEPRHGRMSSRHCLELRGYLSHKLGYCVTTYVLLLMAVIFYLPLSPTWEHVYIDPTVLLDLDNGSCLWNFVAILCISWNIRNISLEAAIWNFHLLLHLAVSQTVPLEWTSVKWGRACSRWKFVSILYSSRCIAWSFSPPSISSTVYDR